MKALKLAGQRFGRLAVERRGPSDPHDGAQWWCRCECGKEVLVVASSLRSGRTRSCGCLFDETLRDRNTKHGHSPRGRRHPLYQIWAGMIARCENAKHISWPYYGARGIRVCDRWRNDFDAFLADVGPRPSPHHSIDRINPGGDYEPSNVRWATGHQQRVNRRSREAAHGA